MIASEAGSVWDVDHWVRCSDEERSAVAWTVLNRLESGEHGQTFEEVVTEPGQYAYNQEPTLEINELSRKLIEGQIPDPIAGATHFFSPISMPKEGEPTDGFDVGGGLHEVPGIADRVYFPSWTNTMTWVGDLDNIRTAYFMFYRLNQLPIANFTYSPENPSSNRQINFNASSSYDPDGTIVSYAWVFGDSSSASGIETTHSYYEASTYAVTLIVTDNDGAISAKVVGIPVCLYPSEEISAPSSGPPSLEFVNLNEEKQVELYEVINLVLNVEQAKAEREEINEDTLFDYMNIMLKQLDPKQKDEDLQETDIIRDNALSEAEELTVSFLGQIAGAGITFLSGIPAPFLGEGSKLLGFELGESLVLGDLGSATVIYPEIGRMEIIYRPSQNKILINAYLEGSVNKNIFLIIPVEFIPLKTTWGTYICSPMWCGITCPPEAAVKEPIPKLEDVQIEIVDIQSPGELRVYDSYDRVTGLVNGVVKVEIPDAWYIDGTVVLFSPSDSYWYEVLGTDEGTYGLIALSTENREVNTLTLTGVLLSVATVHRYTIDWGALSQGEEGVTKEVDSDGDGTSEQITIIQPPVPLFTCSSENPVAAEEVTFDASESYDADGAIVSYEWNFGDGTTSSGRVVTHAYSTVGDYTVSLTVTDDDGALSTYSLSIQIREREQGLPTWVWIAVGAVIGILGILVGAAVVRRRKTQDKAAKVKAHEPPDASGR